MVNNPLIYPLLAFESRHADPGFVTLVAVSSFLAAFIFVVVLALIFPGHSRKEAVNKVVVFFAVVAVPFGIILNVNLDIIEKDRVTEQEILNEKLDAEILRLGREGISVKIQECVADNGVTPFGARKSTEEWCNYRMRDSRYEKDFMYCLDSKMIRQSLEDGPFGQSWGDFLASNETAVLDAEDCATDYYSSETYLDFYMWLLTTDSCSREKWVNLMWLGIDTCERDYSTPSYPKPGKTSNVPLNTPLDDCDGSDSCYPGYNEQDTYGDVTEEDIQDYYDDGPCYGDCYDMDNDGYTWDDYDADGDGLYESWP
jgi:hypothetical protein